MVGEVEHVSTNDKPLVRSTTNKTRFKEASCVFNVPARLFSAGCWQRDSLQGKLGQMSSLGSPRSCSFSCFDVSSVILEAVRIQSCKERIEYQGQFVSSWENSVNSIPTLMNVALYSDLDCHSAYCWCCCSFIHISVWHDAQIMFIIKKLECLFGLSDSRSSAKIKQLS